MVGMHTRISQTDADGDRLRYRGVDLADLVGRVPFQAVWGLLVDDAFSPGLPPAEPFSLPARTGDARVDVQSALSQLSAVWGFRPLLDIDDQRARDDVARASVLSLSMVAQSARGADQAVVSEREVERARTITERFLVRWRGEADPRAVAAIDAYWVALAENGLSPSTYTARIVASTGADAASALAAATAALSGPLHGGAPGRAWSLLKSASIEDDVREVIERRLLAGKRLMGFGHPLFTHEDPRARELRRVCQELQAPLFEVALEVERLAIEALSERYPHRRWIANAELWAPVLLDAADVPPELYTAMFMCARTAGWAAHVLEQKSDNKRIRPVSEYDGSPARGPHDVKGWASLDLA